MWKLLPYIKTSPERDIKSAAAKHCELTTKNKKNSFMYPGIHCHKRPILIQYIYVDRQQRRHQDLTIIRANEHFHDCSGGHFKIFTLYKVNTEGDFLRGRKETLLINILKPSLNDK